MKFVLILIGFSGIAFTQVSAFTGGVTVEGSDPLPNGKFATLRANIGVETPGGYCVVSGRLLDEARRDLGFQSAEQAQQLPPGKEIIHLDFPGAKIAQRGIDAPVVVSGLALSCQAGLRESTVIEDRQAHRTSTVPSADFDGRAPDFEFIAGVTNPVAAGDPVPVNVRLRNIGAFASSIGLTVTMDARLQPHFSDTWVCHGYVECWRNGMPVGMVVTAPADIPSGNYDIQIVGQAGNTVHAVRLTLVVDPALTQRKKKQVEALEALKSDDFEPPPDPPSTVAVRLASLNEPPPAVKFIAGVNLRKIHAVLVLDRSTSMRQSCEFLKASAIRFTTLFIEGRDSVAIIDYGLSVDTMLPLADQFQSEAKDRISKMQCAGATNTGGALEAAQAELAAHKDSEAVDAVILFTDGVPNVLTANWPVEPTPRSCNEASNGLVAATLMPTFSYEFEPAGISLADEIGSAYTKNRTGDSCFGVDSLRKYAYIPEEDFQGVSLTGGHPVDRYTEGPNAGKIRLDSWDTIFNAILNQVDNAARKLRTSAPGAAFVYLIGFQNSTASDTVRSLSRLQDLANDPAGPSFDPKQPQGFAILTVQPGDFWPAFLRVRKEIVARATVP